MQDEVCYQREKTYQSYPLATTTLALAGELA